MSSGVTNLSDSKPVAVYTCIEVDASVAPEAIEELSRAMKAAAATHAHLFDPTFDCKAYIMNVVSPLKYQVRDFCSGRAPPALLHLVELRSSHLTTPQPLACSCVHACTRCMFLCAPELSVGLTSW